MSRNVGETRAALTLLEVWAVMVIDGLLGERLGHSAEVTGQRDLVVHLGRL